MKIYELPPALAGGENKKWGYCTLQSAFQHLLILKLHVAVHVSTPVDFKTARCSPRFNTC